MASSPLLALACHSLWPGDAMAQESAVLPSGYAALDQVLPGGGWPVGGLIELLQHGSAAGVWSLVAPALAQALLRAQGPVVLVGAPFIPFMPALAARGVCCDGLLRVQGATPQLRLWAAEEALRCADVAAVLAWLPQAQNAQLRRLHLAAQRHRRLLWVMREPGARNQATPARLRLLLETAGAADPSARHLLAPFQVQVQVLKRRGPPLTQPLWLPAHPQPLAALLALRQRVMPAAADAPSLSPSPSTTDLSHALDRIAAAF